MRHWLVAVGILVLLIVGILWIKPRTTEHPAPHIGVILATTGPADYIGRPEEEELRALLREYDSQDPHIKPSLGAPDIRDSQGDAQRAVAIFDEFVRDPSVIAVIGPSTSGESIAVAAEAEKLHSRIPVLSLAASQQIVIDNSGHTRPWIFKFAQNDGLAAERLLRHMIATGKHSVALLYSNDGFGKSGAHEFKSLLGSAHGIRLVEDEVYPSALQQPDMFARAIPDTADAIMIWGTAPGPALLVQAIRQRGLQGQIYLSHGNATEEFVRAAGPDCENTILVGSRVLLSPKYLNANDPADNVILQYQNSWRSRVSNSPMHSSMPSHFGGHARDALQALLMTLSDGAKTPPDIRDHLETLSNFHGVTGTFSFNRDDHAGLSLDAFQVYAIRGGGFIPVELK